MQANRVRRFWRDGALAVNGWLAIPASYSAAVRGHQGYDATTVDLQHGMIGFDWPVTRLQELSATPAMPMARVPGWGARGMTPAGDCRAAVQGCWRMQERSSSCRHERD